MSGLGEILEENSRLREMVHERDGQLVAQAEPFMAQLAAHTAQFMAQLATQAEQIAALKASNEPFALHFAFLKKRREMAAAERLEAAERQSPLFEGLQVQAPPRDPELETADASRDDKTDGRKTAKHPRKGRRDVSALPFPRQRLEAPVNPSTCERCGGDRQIIAPRVSHRVGWVPGHFTVVEIHQQRCQCAHCPKAEVWTAPEPGLIPGAMCDDSLFARILVDKFGDHRVPRRRAQQPKGRRSKSCCMDDEGRSLGIGMQVQVSNYHELLGSRVRVVSVVGKGAGKLRQVRSKKASASEPLMTCRKESTRRQNRAGWLARDEPRGSLFTGWAASGMKAA